jgi:hypothetical protein
VFLHLAADALDWCRPSRTDPLPLKGLRERFLPEGHLPCPAEHEAPVRSAGRSSPPGRDQTGTCLRRPPGGRPTTCGSTPCSRRSLTSARSPAGLASRYARHARTSPSVPATQRHNDQFGTQRKRSSDHRAAGHNGGYFACSDVRRHKSTRKPGPDLGDPGCRDQGVKAWSGPTKKPDRPDPAKGNRRPGRSAKLLAPGYRHVGPPAAAPAGGPARCGAGLRRTGSRTARAIGRKAL